MWEAILLSLFLVRSQAGFEPFTIVSVHEGPSEVRERKSHQRHTRPNQGGSKADWRTQVSAISRNHLRLLFGISSVYLGEVSRFEPETRLLGQILGLAHDELVVGKSFKYVTRTKMIAI